MFCWICHDLFNIIRIHTHTHAFNGPFSGTTRVSQYQKGKTCILLKRETVSGSGISWTICKSAPRCRQITTPAPNHSVFTGRMPFLPPNEQRQSTEGKFNIIRMLVLNAIAKNWRVWLYIVVTFCLGPFVSYVLIVHGTLSGWLVSDNDVCSCCGLQSACGPTSPRHIWTVATSSWGSTGQSGFFAGLSRRITLLRTTPASCLIRMRWLPSARACIQ